MAEYEVLIRHTVDLQLAVKENLTSLGGQLVSAQIITPDQYREIRNTHRPVNERGADLVGYVQNKVRQDPRHYDAFIGALKSDLSQYSDILTKLEQARLLQALELQTVIPHPPPREGGIGLSDQDLCQRIESLETKFRGLYQKLVSEVTKKRLPVDDFHQALAMLPIAFRKEYGSSIQQILPAAKESDGQNKCVVTSNAFLPFSPLFVFIDYDLLNHMIVKFGSVELINEMALYIEDIRLFMKETKVGDLIDHWGGCEVSDLNYAKLKAKFRDDPMTYTLERLNKFRRRICSQVRLSEFIFCLIALESAESFFATWIIPAVIIPELSESIKQLNKDFFEEEHIILLFVDQKQLYPSVISKSQYEKFSKDMSSEQPAEWLTTSLSDDYQEDISKLKDILQVPSAVVQPPASPEKRQKSVEMIRCNMEEIKAIFSSLVLKIQSALQSQSNTSTLRDFLITFFKCDFPETSDVKKLFAAVTLNDLWNYHHFSPLERLVNQFLPHDQEVGSLMKEYKARLSGFYLTTKLIDYIEYQNLSADDSDEECDHWQPSPKLTPKQYKKIKMVLQLERKISQVSLDYVVKLWQSFAEEYEIPSLTAVIDRIVAGSLEVTWTVPDHIADAILPRSKFFRSHGIVLVSIDDVIIYDEKLMVVKEEKLLELCYDGTADIRDFSSLLAQGVDPDIYDQYGQHPLWHVSYDGRQDLVELLLKYRADIDMPTKDDFGETALVAAVDEGHLHVTEILVKNGADVNYRNKKGDSILWKASLKGRTKIIELFLHHHVAVDLPTDDEYGEIALFATCSQGHYDPAALLIDHGADVNYLSKEGVTPMYFAANNNHLRLVELLLAHGADINKGAQSPLYASCLKGNIEMVQLLVHHHAAIDQPCDDEYAATPLIAASDKNHIEVARFLVEHGAIVNYQNKYGNSSFQVACIHGNTDIIKLLIQSNVNIELKNKEGRTGLMFAAWRGHSSIVAELIRAGAQIDAQDQNGLTAYDFASSESHAAVCQLLEQYYYGYEPSPLAPAPLQPTSQQHGPITSLQTFRDILEHGSELSDTPKHQESDTAPQQHSYDETAS